MNNSRILRITNANFLRYYFYLIRTHREIFKFKRDLANQHPLKLTVKIFHQRYLPRHIMSNSHQSIIIIAKLVVAITLKKFKDTITDLHQISRITKKIISQPLCQIDINIIQIWNYLNTSASWTMWVETFFKNQILVSIFWRHSKGKTKL